MQTHRYSFFGQKTAMIFQSGDWGDPWSFLTFIKKRDASSWEKLAEGKTIKLSLPEIVALRAVVAGEKPEWKAFHKSNGTGTPISARLESSKEGSPTVLLSAGDYLRPVTYPETVILENLLAHVFEEKIAHATGTSTPKPAPEESPQPEPATEATEMKVNEVRLKSIRTEHGTTTLFLKLVSGTIEEIPASDIVGVGIHGADVDLVIKAIPSPKKPDTAPAKAKPVPKRGKADSKPEVTPEAPGAGEATTVYATSIKQVIQKALLVTKAGGHGALDPEVRARWHRPHPHCPAGYRVAIRHEVVVCLETGLPELGEEYLIPLTSVFLCFCVYIPIRLEGMNAQAWYSPGMQIQNTNERGINFSCDFLDKFLPNKNNRE